MSRWLCLDADRDEGRLALTRIAITLDPACSLFELSRRGAHLWQFCPPTPWQAVRTYGQHLLECAGLSCEVFPKGEGRKGVRVPGTRHPLTGESYPIIDPATGAIRELDDLQRLMAQSLPAVPQPPTIEVHPTAEYGPDAFGQLRREVEQLTRLRQYGPERAIGRCPFHETST